MQPPVNLPKRNIQLLRDTIDYIDAHPDEHDQDDWVQPCGTAFCYAGHAALLAGATRPGLEITRGESTWYVDTQTLESVIGRYFDVKEHVLEVSVFAEQKLGLTYNEADIMFSEVRTRAELRLLVDAFDEGAWISDDDYIWVNGELCHINDWFKKMILGVKS